MAKFNFQVARSMSLLKSPDLAPFVEHLKAERQEALEGAALHTDPMLIYRDQGKAQFLKRLLEDIAQSDAHAAKLRQQ